MYRPAERRIIARSRSDAVAENLFHQGNAQRIDWAKTPGKLAPCRRRYGIARWFLPCSRRRHILLDSRFPSFVQRTAKLHWFPIWAITTNIGFRQILVRQTDQNATWPIPFCLAPIRSESERDWNAAMKRVLDHADIVVPAHDSRIPKRMPEEWFAIPGLDRRRHRQVAARIMLECCWPIWSKQP